MECALTRPTTAICVQEAKITLHKGISLWLPADGGERVADVPPYPSRIACAKLLLELGELQVRKCVCDHVLPNVRPLQCK